MPEPSAAARAAARRTWLRHLKDQQAFDRELAKILRTAAKDAETRLARILGTGVSAQVERAQLKIAVAMLRQLSDDMWGGRITPLMQAHTARAIELGITGVMDLDRLLFRMVKTTDLRDSMIRSAQGAADHVRSRLLNDIKLSPKVYKTQALSQKLVQRQVNSVIARGGSARDIARSVRRLIDPNVRGGVSYAARRLGRTELNNAFHTSTIRAAADQPWVEGFQWNLSGSHPVPDECDDYATEDGYDLGAGVFPPNQVPGKPHPQCLCYITTVMQDDDAFIDALVAGQYNSYIQRFD